MRGLEGGGDVSESRRGESLLCLTTATFPQCCLKVKLSFIVKYNKCTVGQTEEPTFGSFISDPRYIIKDEIQLGKFNKIR